MALVLLTLPGGVQEKIPEFASIAVSHPRTPNSPPLLPTSSFPFTTTGAIVIVSPLVTSPSCVFHFGFPVFASSATMQSEYRLSPARSMPE